MEESVYTAQYLRKVENVNIKIHNLDNDDKLLQDEVVKLLEDNNLCDNCTTRIYAITTNMYDFDFVKKNTNDDLWSKELKLVINSSEKSLYRYMYMPNYWDNIIDDIYSIRLPFNYDELDYQYIVILLNNDNVIIGRYGIKEQDDKNIKKHNKCYYYGKNKQVAFEKLDEPFKSLIIEKISEEKQQGLNMDNLIHLLPNTNENLDLCFFAPEDYLLWNEAKELLKDNDLWDGLPYDDEQYFRHAKKIFAVVSTMFNYDNVKKNLMTPDLSFVINSFDDSLLKYMYKAEYCDNYYGNNKYSIELPILYDNHEYNYILILLDNGNVIIGRYGTTEFGYETDKCHYYNGIKQVAFNELDEPFKSLILNELQNEHDEQEKQQKENELEVHIKLEKYNEYKIYSSFLMICNCKSFSNIPNINTYISIKLNTNNYTKQYLFQTKEKQSKYNIALYDLYKDEYWILDKKHIEFLNVNYNDIEKYVIQYVEDNNKIFKLCFIEMKHYLLKKLNNTNQILFKKIFVDYYKEYSKNKKIISKYYNDFILILEKIKDDKKIGNCILENYEIFFNNMLNDYCITHYLKENITDANYIIRCIDNLL